MVTVLKIILQSNLIEDAIHIATHAHRGQTCKAGQPYILHPMRLMLKFNNESNAIRLCGTNNNDLQIVAMLHDVVEDSECTIDYLSKIFPEHIVRAVDMLTHRKEQSYDEYIRRIVKDMQERNTALAAIVKMADLEDHLNPNNLKKARENLCGEQLYRFDVKVDTYERALIWLDSEIKSFSNK